MKLKTQFTKLLTLILAISLLFIVPILLVLFSPFILLRFAIGKSAKYIKPELGDMLSTFSSILAGDDLHKKPASTFCIFATSEGTQDIKDFQNSFQTRVLDAKLPSGKEKYPQLHQHITTWAGYFFWKDVPKKQIDVANHVKLYTNPTKSHKITDDDLQKISQEMVTKPWAKNTPLWEIYVIQNYYPKAFGGQEPHSVMFLRFHHTLADGYSWMYLFIEDLCQHRITASLPNYAKRPLSHKILFALILPFRIAYDFANVLTLKMLNLPFRVTSKLQGGTCLISLADRISLKKMKEVRAYFKVSFSAVVHAVMAGAYRDMLLKKRLDIPRELPFASIAPLPGHLNILQNHMTVVIPKLPTGEVNPVARLRFCHDDFESVKRSTVPILFKFLPRLVGTNFVWILRRFQNHFFTTGLSNFSAGIDYVSFNGNKWMELNMCTGLQVGCTGLAVTSLGYVDGFRITVAGTDKLFTQEELDELTSLLPKHVEMLHKLCINKQH